jgi:hypothetical protein
MRFRGNVVANAFALKPYGHSTPAGSKSLMGDSVRALSIMS